MKSIRSVHTLFTSVILMALLFGAPSHAQTPTANKARTFGDGVAAYSLQNYDKAVEIWTALAEGGDREAQYRLGMMYQDGRGVSFDMVQAAHWQKRAGEAGHGRAQYLLGNMYATGAGVEEDALEAFRWYLRAAESGQARAQFHVATQYLIGEVVEKNFLDAHIWFAQAFEGFGPGVDKTLALEARDKTFAVLSEEQRAKAEKALEKERDKVVTD